MLRSGLVMVAMFVCGNSFAYGTVSGKVVEVRVDRSGRGMVMFDQQVTGAFASCRISAYSSSLAFDANSAGGKAVLALVLAAKATGDTVTAIGLGSCAVYGGTFVEDWDYGAIG